jgi:hypothetical protein
MYKSGGIYIMAFGGLDGGFFERGVQRAGIVKLDISSADIDCCVTTKCIRISDY